MNWFEKGYKVLLCYALVGFCILFVSEIANAETFCVSDAIELQNALTTAESNGKDDIIQAQHGTYYGNFTYSSFDGNGIALLEGSSNNIYNNIIWGNLALVVGKDIGFEWFSPEGNTKGYNNDYSDLYGTWTDSGDNIDQDPLFVNSAAGDFHLRLNSPCIDAGTNNAPDLPTRDFEGNPRIVDGYNTGTAEIDIGAYEYVPLCQ